MTLKASVSKFVPKQAEVVGEIFERYASGESLQRIAADLNERRVPGPERKRSKPSTRSVSALYGTPKAGSGLLNNELYVGRYVWNRREWVKDPDNPTRRVPRMRPPEEWKTTERPDLRIVSDELWRAVRTRMASPRRRIGQRGRSAPRCETDALLVAELQTHLLAPDAIAKIEQRVRSLLGALQDKPATLRQNTPLASMS